MFVVISYSRNGELKPRPTRGTAAVPKWLWSGEEARGESPEAVTPEPRKGGCAAGRPGRSRREAPRARGTRFSKAVLLTLNVRDSINNISSGKCLFVCQALF